MRDDYETYTGGLPGEYIYGENRYIDDYYMDERWKQIREMPEYWVSDKERVWSNISNSFVEGSPNGKCGHIDLSLRNNGRRVHKYLHRVVAEAFIPNPHKHPIVRHLDDDPSNNSIENLSWGTQIDNMQDCIHNGNFRFFDETAREKAMSKRRMAIVASRLSDNEEIHFESQQEAARILNVSQTCISDVIRGRKCSVKGLYFRKANNRR